MSVRVTWLWFGQGRETYYIFTWSNFTSLFCVLEHTWWTLSLVQFMGPMVHRTSTDNCFTLWKGEHVTTTQPKGQSAQADNPTQVKEYQFTEKVSHLFTKRCYIYSYRTFQVTLVRQFWSSWKPRYSFCAKVFFHYSWVYLSIPISFWMQCQGGSNSLIFQALHSALCWNQRAKV